MSRIIRSNCDGKGQYVAFFAGAETPSVVQQKKDATMTTANTNIQPTALGQLISNWWGSVTGKMIAITRTMEFRVLLSVALILILWGSAIATFGYPALILPMLCMVPTMFVVLLLITVGK